MTSLKRYNIEAGDGPGIYTDRDPEGEWVRASDAAELEKRNRELQAVVNMTAEAFDGGPDNPWIPGFDAQKIYKAVMKNYAPALPSGQSGDPSQ